MFEIGDKVKINCPGHDWHGKTVFIAGSETEFACANGEVMKFNSVLWAIVPSLDEDCVGVLMSAKKLKRV